jgi:hypothetical protein
VQNLNTQVLGSKVFKFNYDSERGLPYIEFPSDISSLIGSGLSIYYTVTSGSRGNAATGTLTELSAPDSIAADQSTVANPIIISDLSENLNVTNSSAAISGEDPETIDQAYSNFKKVVGTFDTLITCRDYANFIYNILDDATLRYLVSNVQAGDRRTDYNYANNVVTFNPEGGAHIESLSKASSSTVDDRTITPYDICLYPLKPLTSNFTQASYDNSFKPLKLSAVTESADLQEAKCISQNYKELRADDIYCFKNKYKLDIRLSTYDKLNAYQQRNVIENVRTALYKNFNAREVEYGEPIPRDVLQSVIKAADNRISDVELDTCGNGTGITTYFMTKDGNEVELTAQSSADVMQGMVAKNILAGHISLLDITDHYNLEFGQHTAYSDSGGAQYKVGDGDWQAYNSAGYPSINYVDTEVYIPYNVEVPEQSANYRLSEGYKLQANEMIQFASPSLNTEIEYGTYVNYRFEGHTPAAESIPANTLHELVDNEKLTVVYTSVDSTVEKTVEYTATTIREDGQLVAKDVQNIFKANFELFNIDESVSSATIIKDGKKFITLSSNQTIAKQAYVSTTLDDAILYCY